MIAPAASARPLTHPWPRHPRVTFGSALLLLAAAATAGEADADRRRCAAELNRVGAMTQTQQVRITSNDGWSRSSKRRLFWQRLPGGHVNMLFVVLKPESEAGLKVLLRQQANADPVVHVYTPDNGRTRRLLGSGAANSVLGSDLTWAEARHLDNFLRDPASRRLDDAVHDGAPVMVIETLPAADDSNYSRIISKVDIDTCATLDVAFYGRNGRLEKTLTTERRHIRTYGEHRIPLFTTVTDHKRGSRTDIEILAVDADTPLPERLFTLAEIRKSH